MAAAARRGWSSSTGRGRTRPSSGGMAARRRRVNPTLRAVSRVSPVRHGEQPTPAVTRRRRRRLSRLVRHEAVPRRHRRRRRTRPSASRLPISCWRRRCYTRSRGHASSWMRSRPSSPDRMALATLVRARARLSKAPSLPLALPLATPSMLPQCAPLEGIIPVPLATSSPCAAGYPLSVAHLLVAR